MFFSSSEDSPDSLSVFLSNSEYHYCYAAVSTRGLSSAVRKEKSPRSPVKVPKSMLSASQGGEISLTMRRLA